MQPAVILHHYDFSPFSEKVRLAFGLKGMEWHAVDTPVMTPKPDLEPLTNGFRRAPVMQIGADVFCDTAIILDEVERLAPEPSLYPRGQEAVARAVAWWSEKTVFFPLAMMTMTVIGDDLPPGFIEERKVSMARDFSKASALKEKSINLQRLHAHLLVLGDMLGDGRPFLLGEDVSVADLAAYHTLWLARQNGKAEVEAQLPLAPLLGWMERVAALGQGRRHEMGAQEALDVAKSSEPRDPGVPSDGDPSGLKAGSSVVVQADDYAREPVRGTLVAADGRVVVIRHENDRVGAVHLHFPRAGYEVAAA
jgi:glutathione S-transferase